ncbi:DNA internalization-related competence protein ComEC/Rec2 [Shimazuella sp. AN120528]|uniref:DNA internalization-related competence protein ComEC/Rec2 n=1 Tax=Shimazuella soli TaxID=1892854 RepID=UPI001F0E1D28|nr:DNA internalization-related competence protein ComEC/Rec2 [Shimazuella soli]MCH5583821.1 DNA internalization-related competence protein ComEC/Rec2 [Shimazuella soli]
MYRPFVSLTCGWVVGVWLANQIHMDIYWIIAMIIALSGCLFYGKYMKGGPIILCLIGISFGAAYFHFYNEGNVSVFSKPLSTYGIGEIASLPIIDGDSIRFDVQIKYLRDGEKLKQVTGELIRVNTKVDSPRQLSLTKSWNTSCSIQLPLQLERPSPARNPGGFDYAGYLHHYGIHWQTYVPSVAQIQVITCSNTTDSQIEKLRQFLHDQIAELYPAKYAGLLQAMLIGEQHTLDSSTQEIFSTLGLVHVLSISGLHVSILVASLFFCLILCGITREKTALLIFVFLPFYAMLTGGSAPVVRSVIMAMMMLLAVILRRTADAVSFLALALLVQLIWNPYQLWEPGFQLSFLVTLGLVVYVEPLSHHIPVPWHRFRQALSVMLVSQIVSFPVVAAYFYQYSWLSAPVNLIFVPVYSVIVLPLSSLSVLMNLISNGWGAILASITSWVLDVMDHVLRWISGFPYMTYSLSPPTLWWILCYFFIFWFLYVTIVTDRLFVQRLRYVMISALVVLAGILLLPGNHSTTRITMIDVGQGDATLIETAGGKVILIDGGGILPRRQQTWQKQTNTFEVGRDVVVPYLRYRGINNIDTIVMTHGDGDHIRGLEAVVRRFSIGQVLHSAAVPADSFETKLLTLMRQKQIPIKLVVSGNSWQIEQGIQAKILHPSSVVSPANINNGSIVMLLSIYKTNILFTGDMEEPAEKEVLAKFRLPRVHILKVAHHGSKTSTKYAWISKIDPDQALISVGLHNRYGHPKPEVLARLHQFGAQIWRTDYQGAILVHIDPKGYRIESMKKGDHFDGR